jgi:hypothetical protein
VAEGFQFRTREALSRKRKEKQGNKKNSAEVDVNWVLTFVGYRPCFSGMIEYRNILMFSNVIDAVKTFFV